MRRPGNGDTSFVSSSNKGNPFGKRLNIGGYNRKRLEEQRSALCNGILECENENKDDDATTKRSIRSSPYDKNLTKTNRAATEDVNEQYLTTSSILSFLPDSFDPFVNVLRGEVWVVPILVASCFLFLMIVIFEIYLILQSLRERRHRRPASRRHLFLGQILLLGLLLCAAMAVMHALKPTVAVCSVLRIGTGLAYVTVYATLLVKLVFLVSLNSGVYLPATYQSLLLCFAVLIQVVIGVQWLVSSPAKVTFIGESEPPLFPEGINAIDDSMNHTTNSLALNQTLLLKNETTHEEINQTYFGSISAANNSAEALLHLRSEFHDTELSALTIAYSTCNVTFQEEMLGMLYAIFLVIVVVVLAFKARGVRENYREAMYVGLAIGFAVCILLVWVLAAFMVEKRYTDICTACGLVSTAAIIFVIMFMPKVNLQSIFLKSMYYYCFILRKDFFKHIKKLKSYIRADSCLLWGVKVYMQRTVQMYIPVVRVAPHSPQEVAVQKECFLIKGYILEKGLVEPQAPLFSLSNHQKSWYTNSGIVLLTEIFLLAKVIAIRFFILR